MFIGHYAMALSAKKIDQVPSLAIMFVAVQFLDLLWPIFVLLGIETFEIDVGNTVLTPLNFVSYPYSHSLLMTIVWAALFGGIYQIVTKNKKGAWLLATLVISHWVLDFLTHRPDLPLTPFGETKVGLGLWNLPVIEVILEIGLFLIGTYLYLRTMEPKRKKVFASMILLFLIIHLMNIFGPPPPSIDAVAWSANALWLFVLWAWWVEKK